jgi:hypothetical protein
MTTALIRRLVSDRELSFWLRRAVEVNNAVHVRMFLEDNPLRLSANRGLPTIGIHRIFSVMWVSRLKDAALYHTYLSQLIEV